MTTQRTRRVAAIASGIAASFGIAVAAEATVTVSTYAFSNGSEVGMVNNSAISGGGEAANIGRFTLTGTDANGNAATWESFCVDLADGIYNNTNYTEQSLSVLNLSQTQLNQLDALLSHADSYITDAATSAAMQIAVWEVQYETASSYNVSTGAFSVTYPSNYNSSNDPGLAASLSDATAILANVTNGTWTPSANLQASVLTAAGKQSQLVYSLGQSSQSVGAVPEPATWLTLVLGFGFIGWALRRRSQAISAAI